MIEACRRWAYHGQDLVLRQASLPRHLELLQLLDALHDPDLFALLVQHVLGRARALPRRDLILLAWIRPHAVVAGDELVAAASLDAMLVLHALGKVRVQGACRKE